MLRVCLLGLLAVSFVGAQYYNTKTADGEFLLKQKKVYNLLYHISQPDVVNVQLYNEGRAWDIEANINYYSKPEVVRNFLSLYRNGLLGRKQLFSVYYPKLLNEMDALFKLFYYANDFDTFYKTALWARIYINEGQFACALYNAVIRRPDTMYIQLPPLYELYPYSFFNMEVLQKAHHAKIFGKLDTDKSSGYETYVIPANYSGWYMNREYDLENKLNYFVEDVGLSSYYFLFRQQYPFWLESKEFSFPEYRGQEYLYGHQQLLNRYNLERLSNDLPVIADFDWSRPFYAGYYPTMSFHNGLPMPQRQHWSNFPVFKFDEINDIRNIESRITAAIDSGYIINNEGKWINIYTPEGLNILGNLIEGNADSSNIDFYGNVDVLSRKILGFNLEPTSSYQIVPSALETFATSMRDPAFYRLYKRIISYYYRYKQHQKPYSIDQIVFPNLKIQSFVVDKLITYFDQFDSSISNGLLVENEKEADSILVKLRQYRLNHKPFSFHIAVNADKPMKVAARIFLGPKYDSRHKLIELPENFRYFYEIDNWILELNAGLNKITRNSKDLFFLSSDPEPSEVFYKKLLKSIDGSESLVYNERIAGFPERLLLPKGDYKFDNNSFGFPLDRPILNYNYDGPNMVFKDILIYHKDDMDMDISY
ncbi:PREDICTED: arylphorin subunit alpha [Dufourea novaeangliae]|uniref:Arylphorin subunit alpha n=1 Tax=Dufourea novaeangliae TaxID=178035 RepID=A0A154P5U9_DUFNO|nr:PREDICTED: arylphorin subunit alpha [Dufourea novaeangliae]KZC07221.1 Arylphorin subunit alpha [Dufourea novaeangliae]